MCLTAAMEAALSNNLGAAGAACWAVLQFDAELHLAWHELLQVSALVPPLVGLAAPCNVL